MRLSALLLFPCVVALFSAGCATTSIQAVDTTIKQEGISPSLGEVSTAPVGSVLFDQFNYSVRQNYSIVTSGSVRVGLGRVRVSPGDALRKVLFDGQTAYCTEKRAYSDPLVGPSGRACFFDANGDGRFETVQARPGSVWLERDLSPPIEYEHEETIIPDDNAFKYQLLYQGVTNQTLRIGYREFFENFARPAFYQELTYDIDDLPTEVGFRNVRIEVLEAGNSGIRYRVLSGFQ